MYNEGLDHCLLTTCCAERLGMEKVEPVWHVKEASLERKTRSPMPSWNRVEAPRN